MHYLVLEDLGASDQDTKMCGVFMDATFHGGSSDAIGSRVRRQRPEIANFSSLWQLPTSMTSLFLSSAINLSPVSLSPAIIDIAGINDTSDH
jgi:hypothetical protein